MRIPLTLLTVAINVLMLIGCGTTQQRTGTEQLLLSDAVDRTVDQLDLAVLSGRKVFLDTTYINPVKGTMFVNADYDVDSMILSWWSASWRSFSKWAVKSVSVSCSLHRNRPSMTERNAPKKQSAAKVVPLLGDRQSPVCAMAFLFR